MAGGGLHRLLLPEVTPGGWKEWGPGSHRFTAGGADSGPGVGTQGRHGTLGEGMLSGQMVHRDVEWSDGAPAARAGARRGERGGPG